MSYQIITKMAYNASTRHIETWQHSNNVWPRTDHFYAMDVGTDEKMFPIHKTYCRTFMAGTQMAKTV